MYVANLNVFFGHKDKKKRISLYLRSRTTFLLIMLLLSPPFILSEDSTSNPAIVNLVFKPVVNNETGSITHLSVHMEIKPSKKDSKENLVLRAPARYASVVGASDRIEGLQVSDRKGSVALEPDLEITEAGGMIIWKRWKSSRVPSGKITVEYQARIPEPKPRRGPPYELSVQGGGISGAGCGFLAFPEISGHFQLSFHWDLKHLDPDSQGLSTLGDGDFSAQINIDQIFNSFFIAGPLGTYPEKDDIKGFKSAWLGKPVFDAKEISAWTAKAFSGLRAFFRSTEPQRYRFFMIAGPENMGVGGTGLGNSFMLFVPTDPELSKDPRSTIAHEMIHYWVGGMEGDAASNFWFTEGLTVHYTRSATYKMGLFTTQEYLEDVNRTVYRYITNPKKNLPNDQIGKFFWQDRNVQIIPYDRGSLYFAHLDAEIRTKSENKRSLDSIIFELFDQRNKGILLTQEKWLEKIQEELGPDAKNEFYAIIIRGEDFDLEPSAFGDEFERIPITVHQFELGFDESIFSSNEKVVTGLVKGCEAEKAGLQNGDRILSKIDLNTFRESENARLKLVIERNGKTKEVEYWPRGKRLNGYKWIPKSKLDGIPFKKKGQGIFNGVNIDYSIVIEDFGVSHGVDGPTARIVSIAYLANQDRPNLDRPVIFLFNGGPIVPSFCLHVGAFGPKRASFPDDLTSDISEVSLVDNKYTVLDVADLVFYDPAGTGWSRVIEGSPDSYFSVEDDARQLAQFIRAWCDRHNRFSSAKFLFGESYGTLRAAVAAQKLIEDDPTFKLDGIFLLGQALNIIETSSRPQNVISYVVSLPTLASLAWYHGRVDKRGRSFEKFLDEVRTFAKGDYLRGLFLGSMLPEADKVRLSKRLSEFTGLPADFYYAKNLRLNKYQFRVELLKENGEVLGVSDGRYKAKAKGGFEIPDPAEKVYIALRERFRDYVDYLGISIGEDYKTDSPVKGLEGWKWGATTPFSDWPYMAYLNEVMDRNPDFRVVFGAGYFDLQTTVGATEYAVTQSGWPSKRVKICYYNAGHIAYSNEQSLKAMMNDVKDLVLQR